MTNAVLHSIDKFDVCKITNCNVLLAEDCELNARLLSMLFNQKGIQVQVAKNGREAIDKIQLNSFDIVLMDLEMPVMNGYEATAVIRQQLGNTIPVIAMTAHTRPGEKAKCLQAGMNANITKPADEEVIFSTIYKLTHNTDDTFADSILKEKVLPVTADQRIYNLTYLLKITRGNKARLNKIIKMFLQQIPEELGALTEAIERTKYITISDIAHKLKTSIAVLGIVVLKPVLDEIEQLGNISSGIEKIMQLNCQVNTVFRQVLQQMAKSKIRTVKLLNV
jgi:CheY-like chemotaxis protein